LLPSSAIVFSNSATLWLRLRIWSRLAGIVFQKRVRRATAQLNSVTSRDCGATCNRRFIQLASSPVVPARPANWSNCFIAPAAHTLMGDAAARQTGAGGAAAWGRICGNMRRYKFPKATLWSSISLFGFLMERVLLVFNRYVV
jgi:hypothetical protein